MNTYTGNRKLIKSNPANMHINPTECVDLKNKVTKRKNTTGRLGQAEERTSILENWSKVIIQNATDKCKTKDKKWD